MTRVICYRHAQTTVLHPETEMPVTLVFTGEPPAAETDFVVAQLLASISPDFIIEEDAAASQPTGTTDGAAKTAAKKGPAKA